MGVTVVMQLGSASSRQDWKEAICCHRE